MYYSQFHSYFKKIAFYVPLLHEFHSFPTPQNVYIDITNRATDENLPFIFTNVFGSESPPYQQGSYLSHSSIKFLYTCL